MRDFFYLLLTDRKSGGIYDIIKAFLWAVSVLYGAGLFVRTLLYRYRIFETRVVPMKVISVGNITLGGTGKTPFVVELTEILRSEFGKEPAVLIRGYGWDESAMLKAKLKDTPILVGEDRARSAHRAIKLYGSDTAILDDGFQHWELGRDINIVLLDSRKPFGNGHLFPRGTLRENKSALARADIIVLTKIGPGADTSELLSDIRGIRKDIGVMEAAHRPDHLYDTRQRKDVELSRISGKRAVLLSSIGDPDYFAETVRGLGAAVVDHMAYGDHHNYSESDRQRIMKRCSERAFDLIITTEKDAVKLARMSITFGDYPLMVLVIKTEIIKGREILIDRLNSLYSR